MVHPSFTPIHKEILTAIKPAITVMRWDARRLPCVTGKKRGIKSNVKSVAATKPVATDCKNKSNQNFTAHIKTFHV